MQEDEEFQKQVMMMHAITALAGILGFLALAFMCCVCCGMSSLKAAINVIDAASDFMRDTKRIIIVPVIYFFATMFFLPFWAAGMSSIASMNEIKADPLIPQAKDVVWTEERGYMALYYLFAGLWFVAWLDYSSTFVIIVSSSTYYYNSASDHQGGAEVMTGFYMTYCNHLGSIAFGAFIIAVIQFIRIVFVYMAKKIEKNSGDNACVKTAVKCAHCVLACLEKVCDYINKNAFSYMAASGQNFCSSAWNGFLLNIKHLAKFTFAKMIAIVFILLGKLSIVAVNVFTFDLLCTHVTPQVRDEVGSLLPAMVVVGLITYFITNIFLGMFSTVVGSLLVSLAIDLDMNNGKPRFGPPTFHDKASEIQNE